MAHGRGAQADLVHLMLVGPIDRHNEV